MKEHSDSEVCQSAHFGSHYIIEPASYPDVSHQSLAFRARLCHAKNEAPVEEAVIEQLLFLATTRHAWGNFHAHSRFARCTIPEGKWGTTRILPLYYPES